MPPDDTTRSYLGSRYVVISSKLPPIPRPRQKRGTGSIFKDRTNDTWIARVTTVAGPKRRRAPSYQAARGALADLLREFRDQLPESYWRRPRKRPRDRDEIGPRLRFTVLNRDAFTCRYCGAKAPDVQLHVDHVVALADGGLNELTNLVTACRPCNLGKGGRSL